jgi:hypothetical protein
MNLCEGGSCSCYCEPKPSTNDTCASGAPATKAWFGDPEVFGQISGSNGTFLDACDASGNLIEAVCETETICEGEINPACADFETGIVTTRTHDCAGTCSEATCRGRCPLQGDTVKYLDVGAYTLFVNEIDGRQYRCELVFGDMSTCNASTRVNQSFAITGLGLRGGPCTGLDFGNIGLESCTYDCDIVGF